jgi:hypothetical protein
MPWTFAHPAAILPLRRRLPLAALAIGSVSPDIGYYLGLFPLATFAHTGLGLLLACLPTGAAMLVAWHLLRKPVIELLPQPHRAALQAPSAATSSASRAAAPAGLRRAMLLAAGLVVGAATHNAWDSFTHASGSVVQWLDALRAPVFGLGGRTFRLFNLLQHASTLLGLAALIGVYFAWLRRQPHAPAGPTLGDELWRWALLVLCAAVAITTGAPLARHAGFTGEALVFRGVLCATQVFVSQVVAFALLRRAGPWLPGLPFIQLCHGAIRERWLLQRQSIRLDELQKIEYAYHAVVGFVAVWIFTARDGREIVVAPQRPGLSRLLSELETQLPGFSLAHWRREFEAGDVEDTLLVWAAAEPSEFDNP